MPILPGKDELQMLPPPPTPGCILIDDTTCLAALDESVHGLVNIFNAVSSRELHTDPRMALRDNLEHAQARSDLLVNGTMICALPCGTFAPGS